MQVWASTMASRQWQLLENFWLVVFWLGHQWLLEFLFIYLFIANGSCKRRILNTKSKSPQEVAQSAGTTPIEVEVTSSNLPSSSCMDMSQKKKKTKQKKNKTKQKKKKQIKEKVI